MSEGIDPTPNPKDSSDQIVPTDGRCPIDALPPEILAHIFARGWAPELHERLAKRSFEDLDDDAFNVGVPLWAWPARTKREEYHGGGRRLPFNVLVSHVCARWRAIAVDSPLLWSYVRFDGYAEFDRAKTYMERAKDTPIEVDVWGDWTMMESHPGGLEVIDSSMALVVSHVAHCRALKVMVSFYPHMHRALEMLGRAGPAPILEVLRLYHYEDADERVMFEHATFEYPELREQPSRLFEGVAPRLTHVALWGVHIPWDRMGAPYLTGLTELELAYHSRDVRPSMYDFARILRDSPDLRTLTLCCSCAAGTPAEWPPGMPTAPPEEGVADLDALSPLALPKLTELVLAHIDPFYLRALLPRLALPALTSLTLDLKNAHFGELLAHFPSPTSLLANLTSLQVTAMQASEADVRSAYQQMQALTSLKLNAVSFHTYWVDLLFPQDANPGRGAPELLLPRLESLMTKWVDGKRLRQLVEARETRGAPLRNVLMSHTWREIVSGKDEEWFGQHLERFKHFQSRDQMDEFGWAEEYDGQ